MYFMSLYCTMVKKQVSKIQSSDMAFLRGVKKYSEVESYKEWWHKRRTVSL